MDLRMPRMDGVEATRRLRERDPGVKVVVLTTYADDRSVLDALRAGALGYLTKDAGAAEIQQALHRVAGGQAALDPAVQLHLVEAIADGPPSGPAPASLPDGLTPREAEVLTLIAAGLSNAEIAERLVVSEATVNTHINNIFAKTGISDRAQALSATPTATDSPLTLGARRTSRLGGRVGAGRTGAAEERPGSTGQGGG